MEFNTVRLEASSRVQEYSGNNDGRRRHPLAARTKTASTAGAVQNDIVQSEDGDLHHLDDVV